MGKSTISMAIFNSKLLNYQRVIGKMTTRHPISGHPIFFRPSASTPGRQATQKSFQRFLVFRKSDTSKTLGFDNKW
jgi:hypothetical protein